MNEHELLNYLQGEWITDIADLKIIILNNDIVSLYDGKETNDKLFFKFQDKLNKWMVSAARLGWASTFIDDITQNGFNLYNYTYNTDRVINVSKETNQLLGCDTIFIFKKLSASN